MFKCIINVIGSRGFRTVPNRSGAPWFLVSRMPGPTRLKVTRRTLPAAQDMVADF